MLDIRFLNVESLEDVPERYLLSEYRREKLRHLTVPLSRRQSLGSELLLQSAVKEYAPDLSFPVQYDPGSFGRPMWTREGLYFSLSHSGSYAACALSDHPVGLDIQKLSADKPALARRYFTESERRFLEATEDKSAAFTLLWTLKESYVKALGSGLSTPLDSFSVTIGDTIRTASGDALFWHRTIPGYHISLCLLGSVPPVPDRFFEQVETPPAHC